jgi:hypothetical protein
MGLVEIINVTSVTLLSAAQGWSWIAPFSTTKIESRENIIVSVDPAPRLAFAQW